MSGKDTTRPPTHAAGLVDGFLRSAREHSERPALEVGDRCLTYGQVAQEAADLAATIAANDADPRPMAGVLAYRSVTAYVGVLASLVSGKGYVPLNPNFPADRTRKMLLRSGANVVTLGQEAHDHLLEVLPSVDRPLTIICRDAEDVSELAERWPAHSFLPASALHRGGSLPASVHVSPEATAYLLFTSGSTGEPKGVPISHRNITSYLGYIGERYGIRPDDRVSQTFEMTFDCSVHDMFLTWGSGACLCCVPKRSTIAPAKFIRDKELSVWFSVPSVIMFMSRMRMLKPGVFPLLRWSLFAGEPLPATLAEKWQQAAPNSAVENIYGPTEATITISHYRWDSESSPAECKNGVVPIGQAFSTQRACMVDEQFRPLPPGQAGELCLAGSQVSAGYLDDEERTAAQFVRLPDGDDTVWYRTGDRVVADEGGCMCYLGRLDDQVQVHGHRVELQEVDCALRKAAETEMAVAVAHNSTDGRTEGICGFVCGSDSSTKAQGILKLCRQLLPSYMVPQRIIFLSSLPLNPNGKIDRGALAKRLEAGRDE